MIVCMWSVMLVGTLRCVSINISALGPWWRPWIKFKRLNRRLKSAPLSFSTLLDLPGTFNLFSTVLDEYIIPLNDIQIPPSLLAAVLGWVPALSHFIAWIDHLLSTRYQFIILSDGHHRRLWCCQIMIIACIGSTREDQLGLLLA